MAAIESIYDAALDPRRWEDFLALVARAVGAPGAVLIYHDVRELRGTVATSVGIAPEALQKYNEYFGSRDPWIATTERLGLLRTGAVVIGEQVVPEAQFSRTEYYNDFARQYQLSRLLAGVIRRDGCVTSSLSALRTDRHAPFGARQRSFLQALMPHLYRAMQVHQRITGLHLENGALQDAVDRLPMGVMTARADATIVFANRAAQEILCACDGLTAAADGLRATRPAEGQALRSLISRAAATAALEDTHPGGAMTISRPSLGPALSVLVTPLRASALAGLRDPRGLAAVFVTDPARVIQTDSAVLRTLWGLTAAEAEVAVRLAAGRTVDDIRDELAITAGTVRWHIKRVLAKTDSKRQADVVRVLTASPAIVDRRWYR